MKVLKATCFKQLKRFYSFYSCVLPKVIFTLAIAITFKALGSENAGILSYPKTSTNTSFNIQLSPVSYQAAGEELVFLDKDPAAPKTPEELRIIQANKLVREKLNQFFQRSNYRDLLFSYFPGKRTAIDAEFDAKAIQLREAILNHGFHVPVQLLNWQIINSAMAAFSAHGPTGSPVIYFNEDYVAGKASFIFPEANDRQIVGLLLQEYGHAIDFYLNGDNDTPGDEGALFAAKEMGFELSQIDIDGAKIRDDQNRIYVYGKEIEVEEAALVVQTIWPATISSNKVTINGSKTSGSNFRFETVCTGGGTNCTFAGTTGGGNNTVVDFTYKTTGGTITTAVRGELSWRDQSSNPNSVFFNQYSTGSTVSNSGYVVVLLVNATTNAYTSTTQISGNSGPVGSALDAFAVSNTPTTGNSVISANPTTGVIANNTNSSTITVTAKNSSNVAIAGATVTLNQFSDSGLLVPTTRTTISPASTTTDANGVATFTITSTIAPHTTYYQATVVASGFETILSNSASIGFVTGPVSKLQVLMPGETADPGSATGKTGTPTDQVAGSNVTVTVNAVDDWWNKVNTSTPTVAITTSDANAVRPSNAALTAGTGTFTLSFRTAGTQTVTATDQAGSSPLTANTGSNTLVTAGTVNKLQVLMPGETAAPGTASGKTGTPTAQTAGTSLNFTVNAVDPYWNVVSSATPTAVITSSDAQATLPSSSALSSGTKQFALTFKTTGNQTITATDQAATLTANTGSSTVVNSGAANAGMSTLTPTSASIVANGTSTQVLTVTAKDAFGNSISSGGSTVTITKSSGSGTISSVTDNNNGTYTATVTSPIVVGSGVFVATLGGSSVNNGTGSQTQSTVNYITAPASKLVITSISQQTAGSSFAVTVTLTDDNGNAVNATADGTVTLTLKTGTGTLGGTLTGTITSGTSSVTISGVTYTKAESGVVLTATGSGSGNVSGKTGDSNAFNVVAGTATKYLVTSSGYSPVAGATVTISAQLADANNNPVSTNGQTVNWTKSDTNGSFASASTTTNASGIATVVLTTHTVAGTATTVTATTSSITGTSPTITTVAGTATKYLVTSSGYSPVAGATVTISAQLADANNNPVSTNGQTVNWTKSDANGSFASASTTTNASGIATVVLTTHTVAGTATTVTATTSSITGTSPTITTVAGTATKYLVTSSGYSPVAGATVTISAQLADANNNPVSTNGQTVNWTKSDANGSFASASTTTNASGIATVVLTTHTVAGTATTVTATTSSITGTSPTITTVAGTATKYLVTSSGYSPVAGATVTISAQLADANNNPVSTNGQTVNWTKSDANGSFASASTTTNASGIATVVLTTHTVAGTATSVTATTSSITGTSPTITTVAGTATKYLVTSSGYSPVAGTTVTISAQLADANNNPVSTNGQTVNWTKSDANGSFASASTTTNASGIATVVLTTHTVAGTATTVTATTSSITGTSPTITTVAGTATKYLVTSSGYSPVAGATVTISAQLADANNNPVSTNGQTVNWTKSDANGSFASASTTTNASGIATVVLTTHTVAGTATTVTATTSSITGTSPTITTVAGTATKYLVTSSGYSPVAGATVTISAQLADANNNPVSTNGQTVNWTKSDANGSFASASTTTNASGIATVVLTTHTVAGTATTVTATTSSITGTSPTITTVAGTATKYLVTSSGYSPVAGATVTISAQLADANNNPVSTNGQTVNWTKSDANGSFASASTTTNASGIATVVLTTHTVAGTATTVTATTSSITGTSPTITTVAGTATKYLVTSSGYSPVAGATVTISAQLADANNNPVSTNGQTVNWTKSDANGSFASASTTTNASGIATVVLTTHTVAGTATTVTATTSSITGTSPTITTVAGPVDASKSTLTPTSASITADGASTQLLTVTAKDANGNNVGTGGATVTITRHTGTGVIGSVSDGGNGTYTATVTAPTMVGTGEFVATIGGNQVQNGTGSQQHSVITYTVGNAAKLTIQTQPSNTASNAAINPAITVRIEDANGNLTSSTANVTVAIGTNPSSGTLSGTKTVAAVNGVATFNDLSINNAGLAYTLSFSSSGLTGATSNTFNITSGGATKLAFSVQPSNATAGTSISPAIKVQILDAAGNPTSSTDNITLSIETNPASGTLSGTLTQAAVAGEATFTGISINKSSASSYKLKATSGTLTEAISSTFIISPNTPTAIEVTDINPAVGILGINNNIIRVSLKDAYGNYSPAPSDIGVELSLFIGATDRTSDGIERTNSSNVVQSNPIQATISSGNYYTDINYVRYKVSTVDKSTNPYTINNNATIKAAKYSAGGPSLSTGTSAAFTITEGKIYSPKSTGNWNAVTWSISNDGGTTFADTVGIKYNYDKYDIVKIPSGITTTLSQSVSLYSIIIDGTFDLSTGGTLTLNHHSGIDGEYNVHTHGTFKNSGGDFVNTNENGGNGYLPNFHGGTYWHARDGGSIPKALWTTQASGALTKITGLSSTSLTSGFDQAFLNFEWDNSYSDQTMHGNVSIANDFYLKSGSFSIGDNNTLTLNQSVNGSSNGKLKGTNSSTLHVNTTSGSPSLDFASGGQNLKELKVNVTGGSSLTIPADLTINNTLNLVSGHVVMGNNKKLSFPADATITGASDTRYVEGTISRVIPKQTDPSVSFPIGDASAYTPVTLDFSGRSSSSTDLTIESSTNTLADNTSISGSGIRGDKYVKRKWRVSDGSGSAANGFTTYNITLGFPSGDIVGSASLSNMVVRKNSGSWKAPSGHVRTDGSTKTIKGQNFNSFSDFYIGESTGATSFSLNSPADITAGTRAAYVGTRLDAGSLPYTTGAQTAYLFSTSGGVFYDAASGGNVITSVDFADGSSTVNFWFEKTTVGTYTVTLSDATPADAGAGVVDATDDIAVTVGTVNAAASTLTPTVASITANGTSTQVLTVTAKDAYGNNISAGGSTVTITKSSGTGTISSVSDNSNGTYTATVTSPTLTGTGVFVATLGGAAVKSGTANQTQSTITYTEGAASKLVISNIAQQTAGTGFSVTVTLTDANGNPVNATADGTVTLTLKTGNGTLGGTLTGTILNGGSDVTISGVTYTKAESGVELTATGSGSGNVSSKTGNSNAFTVVAGAASKYIVTSSSSSPTAGGTVTITAQLVDANNNPVSTSGKTITWSKSDANGSFSSATSTTDANGTATVTFTSHTVSGTTTTITATDNTSLTGTTSNITTGVGTASKLVVSNIGQQTAGTGFAVTVTLTDDNGNAVNATADGTVTLTRKTGTGTLGGTLTGTITSGSSAVTISGVTYTKAETGVELTATGSGSGNVSGKTGNSNAFTVVAGAASKYIVTSSSSSPTAGGTVTITAQLVDANNNPVSTSGKTITWSKSDANGSFSSATSTTDANGTATVTFTSHTVSGTTTTITATDNTSLTGTTSNITTGVGTASKLVVSNIGQQTAGTGFAVTVTLTDDNGNAVNATADGTVTLTRKTGTGTLGGTLTGTITSGSSAVTISGVTYTKAETGVELTATGSGSGNVSGKTGNSNAFTVIGGTATKLVVSNIGQQTAGTGFSVTVTLYDTNDNPTNATADGTVTLTLKTGNGTLGGTLTGTITSGSSAVTISGVTYTKAETGVELTATGSGSGNVNGKTGNSNAFTVVAGAASKYIVTSSSSSPTAGGTVTITAQLVDANNNPVSTSGKTITWSKSDANGSFSSATSTTDANGTATVTFTSHTVSGTTTTITATDNTSLTGTTSNITTGVGTASKLVVSNIGQQTAGTGFSVTVTLTDDNGNAVNATADGTVTLTRKTGTGTLGGTLTGTIVNGSSAVTISGVTYTKAETGVELTATGSGSGNVSGKTGNSNAFTVVAGAASKYIVTSSNYSPIVGSNITITAQLVDANNNSVSTSGKTITWSKSDGNGSFSSATSTTDANGTATVTFTSHTVSGTTTTITATDNTSLTGTTSNITSDASGASKLVITNIGQQTAGTGFSVTVTLTDDNGNAVNATADGTVTLTRKTGTGTLGGTLTGTIVNGSSAVTISGVTYTKAETGVELTATGSGSGNVSSKTGNSNAFTVVAGAASKYIVTSSSSSPTAGGTVTITAQLVDANNNPVSTSGKTITWSKSDANGSFSSATSTTDANGTATVTFTSHTVSGTTTTITATDNTSLTGTTSNITTGVGTASKLVVSNIGQQTAGTGFAVTVTLTDDNGNAVNATADGTVTLTRKTGTGTLGGTLTGTITSGSSAVTISGVTYTKAETGVELTATGSGSGNVSSKTGNSNAFTVVAGAASKYIVTSSSSSPTAGGTVTITAQLVDANNNPVSTSGKTITWSKSDANGSFSSATSTTDANGTATVTFTSHTVSGTTTTITATDNTSLTGTTSNITTGVGTASKLVVSNIGQQTAGTGFAVTVTLTDDNGNAVNATADGTVTLTRKTGTGTLGGTLTGTITSGSSAVTISGVTYTKAETGVELTATGSGSGNVSGKTGNSNAFTVVAGAASKYIVTSSSSSPTAGGTVTITAQLVDANNNPVSTSGKTITWSKSDANGSFSSATSTTDANGTATVTFTSHTVSGTTTTITATDNTSLTGTTSNITTGVGTASKLVVSNIGQQTAGTGFSVTVTLTDDNGNAVNATANGTVTLTRKTGTGTLGGTLTGTITSGSSAVTISGVTYTKAETGVELTATGSGSGNVNGKTGNSNAFAVVAGSANRFIISNIADMIANSTFSATATLVDANNNLVNADATTTVTFSVKTGTGNLGGTVSGTLASGSSSITISGITYDKVETGVEIKATGTSSGNTNGKIGNSNAFAVSAGTGSKIKLSTINNYVAGTDQTITATLTDDNNNAVLATANTTITITVKTGTGTIAGTYTGTILSGTSSITISGLKYNKAESGIVLRATGSGAGSNANGKVGDSNAFTVSPGPLYRFFITGLTRQEAGTAQTITILAYDQYNNVVPTIAGVKPITFTGATAASDTYKPSVGPTNVNTSSNSGGVIVLNQTAKKTTSSSPTIVNINATATGNTVVQTPGSNNISLNSTLSTMTEFGSTVNLTFTNGTASASIILYKAETATISATDGTINTPKEGELQVEVVHSTFTKLEVTLAPQQIVGQPLVGTLKALDQYGNVVTNFDASQNNITIVVNNLTGSVTGLSGTIKLASSNDFVNGVADFSLLGITYQGGSGSGGFTFTPSTGTGTKAENIVVVADDTDGDGVTDDNEEKDGTDKNDPCSYLLASQVFSKTTQAWKDADCDGDGTSNGYDSAPLNSCVGGIPGFVPAKGSAGYQRYFMGDCDGDGITNDMECYGGYTGTGNCQDFDSDGIPNYQDPDSDGDGILDIIEKNIDSDGDGDANYLDLDSDNDGILDSMERTVDTDGDGTPNYLDMDSDNDGIMDAWEATNSSRGVIDSNYDGRVDINGSLPDANGNGLADFLESNPAPIPDTDKDGTPDYLDVDSDGDGINDSVELTGDPDKDGKPNYRDKDSDGDWLGDSDERDRDNDGDGISNYLDLDSDGDGIPDAWEGKNKCATCENKMDDNDDGWDDRGQYVAVIDTDKDGSPDFLDLDSDNDCIADKLELGGDMDGDDIPNFRDLDSDGDRIPDKVESVTCDNPIDTDKDGIRDFEDLDADGDGIPDAIEAGSNPSEPLDSDKDGLANYRDTDSDGDGILDKYEAGANPKNPIDTDKDGIADYLDLDSDGDSIPDRIEGGGVGFKPLDSDKDGIEDYLDLDSDNDGIPDKVEVGISGSNPIDTDQDGYFDFRDTDSDGDGISDKFEAGNDPNNPVDTDKDGKPDYLDTDSDNDSILDLLELGSDANKPLDSDEDGIPNYRDTDSDNDTILDSLEVGNDPMVPSDFDKDGIPDYMDVDSDNDTIPDKVEVGPNPATPYDTDKDGMFDFRDLDSDNDSIPDKVEAGADPNKPIDTDKDGIPDYRDLDSDNDGIPDIIEVGKNPNNPVDTDRDGLPDFRDLDSDNDGTPDSAGAGSSLFSPLDTDKDGIYDYLDPDDDNDGIPDLLEDDLNYGAMPDCDKDGIPNRLDPDTCNTFVPQGISPNGDGLNDKLIIPGIFNYQNRLSIYNRWGDLVFEIENYKNDWGGESSPNNLFTLDKKLPDGVYYYIVDFFGAKPNISSYVFINRTSN